MKWLAERYLKLRGWEFVGQIPDVPKLVLVGAPHTSNWDFVLFLGALRHFRVKMSYVGKHTLFRWPFGYWFRRWGGIPVDRSKPLGLVNQVVAAMNEAKHMILAMAPEGTRKIAPYWKGGFLRIAQAAGAPIVFAYVDGPHRRVGIGPLVESADRVEVMETARALYSDKQGWKPGLRGPVRLRDEG